MTDLAGRIALITGGSRGIGRAIAQDLAEAGADVVIASRKVDACELAAAEISASTGRRALAVGCHVGRWDDLGALVDRVYGELGRCDILVNNAGMSPTYSDLASVGEDLYDKVHAVNARGPFRLGSLIGPRMAAGDGGSIINISSVASLRPTAGELPYAMAKASLNALSLALAAAWAPKVRSNLVLPGPFDTEIAQAWPPEVRAALTEENPMGRLGLPSDVAGVCTFLAGSGSAYVNGAQILVDGGAYRSL